MAHTLSGAAIDTLHKLFMHGPQDDGGLPSKKGANELSELDLAFRDAGWNGLTVHGVRTALEFGWGEKKL